MAAKMGDTRVTVSTTASDLIFYPGAAMAWQTLATITYDSASDLAVYRLITGASADVLLTRDVDYQIDGNGAAGTGRIRALTARPVDERWIVERVTPLTQQRPFPAHQPFPAKSAEGGLDKLTRLVQELDRRMGKALLVPRDEAGLTLPDITTRPGFFLAFDANGNPYAASGTGADAGLRADLANAADAYGANLVKFVQQLTNAVGRTAREKMADAVSVKDFGAIGDDATSAVTAFQRAADSGEPSIYVPAGTYFLPDAINVMTEGQVWHGPGKLRSGGTRPCLRLFGLLASVSGLTLTGNGTMASSVEDMDGALVRMLGDQQLVAGCTFDGYRYGIEARGHNAPMIYANRLINGLTLPADTNATAGFAIDYRSDDSTHCYHGQVLGNYINGGFGVGIGVFAEDSTSPSGAYNSGTSNGGLHGGIISGNVTANGHMYGVMLYRRGGSGALDVDRWTVTSNYVAGITGHTTNGGARIYGTGIYVQGAEEANVQLNYVRDCAQYTDSTLLSASGIGILNVARGTVKNNIVKDIGTSGAPVEGGGGIVHKASNVTPSFFAAGFGSNPATGGVDISDNLVMRTRLESILSADAVNVTVETNHCYEAGVTGEVVDGIRVYRSGGGQFASEYAFMPDPTVRENTVNGATRFGILLDGTENHQADGNRVSNTVSDGVRIESAGPGSEQGNIITNSPMNGTGYAMRVMADCSPDQIVMGNTFRGGNGPQQLLVAVPALIRSNVHSEARDTNPITITVTATTTGTNVVTTSDNLTTKRIRAGARFTVATNVGNLVAGTTYFVRAVLSPSTFTVCTAIGGAVFALTTAGPVSILATFGPIAMRLTSPRGSDDNGWWLVSNLDTAPNIGHCNQVKVNNSAATTINGFTSLRPNEPFALWTTNGNTTLDFTGSNLIGNGGVDYVMPTNKILNVWHSGSTYYVDV